MCYTANLWLAAKLDFRQVFLICCRSSDCSASSSGRDDVIILRGLEPQNLKIFVLFRSEDLISLEKGGSRKGFFGERIRPP